MLIDQKLNNISPWHRQVCEVPITLIARNKFNAKRYIITDEVVDQIAGMMRDYPKLFVRNYQFAKAPYETIYVEFNHLRWSNHLNPLADVSEVVDLNVGYLVHKNTISVVCNNQKYSDACVMPWVWTVDHLHKLPVHSRNLWPPPMAPETKMSVIWGRTFSSDTGRKFFTPEIIEDTCRRVSLWISRDLNKDDVRDTLRRMAGELRALWAVLLWLHQPKIVHYEEVPNSRTLTKRGPLVYLAHSIVRLQPGVTVRKMMRTLSAGRESPRRHEVGGFFVTHNCLKGCEHPWPILPEDDERWRCPLCKGTRKWVEDYERGDAAKGYVLKDRYEAHAQSLD